MRKFTFWNHVLQEDTTLWTGNYKTRSFTSLQISRKLIQESPISHNARTEKKSFSVPIHLARGNMDLDLGLTRWVRIIGVMCWWDCMIGLSRKMILNRICVLCVVTINFVWVVRRIGTLIFIVGRWLRWKRISIIICLKLERL